MTSLVIHEISIFEERQNFYQLLNRGGDIHIIGTMSVS
jgi:hypothetical protein